MAKTSRFRNKIFIRVFFAVILLSLAVFALFAFITMNSFKGVLAEHLEEMEEYTPDEAFSGETHQIFYRAIDDLEKQTFLILGSSILLATGASFFISSRLTRNLRALTRFIEQVDSGNPDAKIHIVTKDEFWVLAEHLKKMLSSIKTKQRELLSEKTVMESIVLNLSDGVVMFNEQGKITIINKTAEKILRLSKSEILDQNIKDLSTTHNISRLYEIMGRSIAEGCVDEYLSVWEGEKTKVFPVRASSVVDQEGNFWGFLAIIKNV